VLKLAKYNFLRTFRYAIFFYLDTVEPPNNVTTANRINTFENIWKLQFVLSESAEKCSDRQYTAHILALNVPFSVQMSLNQIGDRNGVENWCFTSCCVSFLLPSFPVGYVC
jgi:hypothetical protein